MATQDLRTDVQRMVSGVQTLAALGAEMRLLQEGRDGDPAVRARLKEAVDAIAPGGLAAIPAPERDRLLATIVIAFYEAFDLLADPGRPPGWRHRDPVLLRAKGEASRANIRQIARLVASRPDLAALLARPGEILDVGTGVGCMALEAAATWPAHRVVGIDIWEPSLELARAQVAGSPFAPRVTVAAQDVRSLTDRPRFQLAWLPAPFLAKPALQEALVRLREALVPGGAIVVGLYPRPADPIGAALVALRLARDGGHPWQSSEIASEMQDAGFAQVETSRSDEAADMVLGIRPA
jgi:SAM-dependent methyltransferase